MASSCLLGRLGRALAEPLISRVQMGCAPERTCGCLHERPGRHLADSCCVQAQYVQVRIVYLAVSFGLPVTPADDGTDPLQEI